jgi:ribosome modulation factor
MIDHEKMPGYDENSPSDDRGGGLKQEYKETLTEQMATAFNRGSSDRIAGKGLSDNPYSHADDRHCYRQWQKGWHDANVFWGFQVKGRWHVRPLPQVS